MESKADMRFSYVGFFFFLQKSLQTAHVSDTIFLEIS